MGRALVESPGKVVTNFEAAWIVDGEPEIARFLPEAGHRDRRALLLDLIRVDLRERRLSGRPRGPEDYLGEFPDLCEADLAGLLEPGDAAAPHPGASRRQARDEFGVEVDGWTGDADATVSRRGGDVAGVARSYLAFRIEGDSADPGAIDRWASANREAGRAETVVAIADLHRSDPEAASELARGVVCLPSPGETFLGFRLLGELGRGAFGRVYLASQGDLADRPVALKVSAEKPTESQTLAQLQHTNIVPIFSAHRVGPLHAVCMPYFGRTTLKDVFEDLECRPSPPTSGLGLIETLDSRRGGGSSAPGSRSEGRSAASAPTLGGPDSGPCPAPMPGAPAPLVSDTLSMLGRISYVEAVLWIGARLADGLAHAHGRGILHRDLKPANVLLTDSGQPMLLDFNLSEDTKAPASVASIGGTLPYMAPEHLRAFRGEPTAVDARSDLYALGLILYELLAGRHPFEARASASMGTLALMVEERSRLPADLRERNPRVSPAVESIVRHCLEPDPARRYQSAADLREDLERQMADLPLKHAPEPSTRERLGKWARRHPRLTSSTSVAILVGCVALGVLGGSLARGRRLAGLEATHSLARFRDEASTVRYLLETRVFDRDRRARAVTLGRSALARYGTLADPAWRSRPLVAALEGPDQRDLLEGVGALLMALAKAGQLDAQALPPDAPARREALDSAARLSDLAAPCFEPARSPRALAERRAGLARLLGREDEAAKLLDLAAAVPLLTALDHELAASDLALKGEYVKALPLALEATRLDPRDFWAWFALGLCHERVAQDAEAAACFGTCIALRPDSPFGWFNRGTVRIRRADYDQARLDLDRASALDPAWPDPHSERAIAEELGGKPLDAVRSHTRAFELGATDTRLYFLRARARAKAGDLEGARLDREAGLRLEPRTDLGWVARAGAKFDSDPAGALADLDRALAANPRCLAAMQDKGYVLAEKLGKIAEAEAVLDRAVLAYPDFVPSRSARGVLRALLGRRAEALADARESLWRDTSPRILYQLAGLHAVTSRQAPEDKVEAFRLLSTALRQGYGFDDLADDRELDPIRDEPEFRKLLDAARALRDAAPEAPARP